MVASVQELRNNFSILVSRFDAQVRLNYPG